MPNFAFGAQHLPALSTVGEEEFGGSPEYILQYFSDPLANPKLPQKDTRASVRYTDRDKAPSILVLDALYGTLALEWFGHEGFIQLSKEVVEKFVDEIRDDDYEADADDDTSGSQGGGSGSGDESTTQIFRYNTRSKRHGKGQN